MNKFSSKSLQRLDTVHPDLQTLAHEALKIMDCSVVYGMRTIVEQRELYDKELSKTMNSKHLKQPDGFSHAIDLAPYVNGGIPWDSSKYFYRLAGVLEMSAHILRINIRSGWNWDGDDDLDDQKFMDLVHTEIII